MDSWQVAGDLPVPTTYFHSALLSFQGPVAAPAGTALRPPTAKQPLHPRDYVAVRALGLFIFALPGSAGRTQKDTRGRAAGCGLSVYHSLSRVPRGYY